MKASGNNDVLTCCENLFKCQKGECFLVRDKGLTWSEADRPWTDQNLVVWEAQKLLERFEHPSRLKDYEIQVDQSGHITVELGVYNG